MRKVFTLINKNIQESNESERTFSFEEIKKVLKNELHFEDWQINSVIRNKVSLILIVPFKQNDNNDDEIKNAISSVMNKCGFFFSKKSHEKIKDVILYGFEYHPYNQMEVTDEVVNSPNKLLHITPKYAYDEIISEGMIKPLSRNMAEYPERIYLFCTDDLNMVNRVANNLCLANSDTRNNSHYCILEIDKNISKYGAKFYYDPDAVGGFFTTSIIPINYILKVYDLRCQ